MARLPELRGELRETRIKVADRKLGVDASTSHYSEVVDLLIEESATHLGSLDDGRVNLSNAYLYVVRAKEEAGLERAMGTVAFGAKRLEPMHLKRLHMHRKKQDEYIETAGEFSGKADRDRLTELYGSFFHSRLRTLRSQIDQGARDGTVDGSPEVWWNAATEWVDALQEEENRLAGTLRAESLDRAQGAGGRFALFVIVGSVALLLCLGAAQIAIVSIRRELNLLYMALVQALQGKTVEEVPFLGQNDEMARIAGVVETLRAANAQPVLRKNRASATRAQHRDLQLVQFR